MITQEMMNAATQQRASDIARLQLERNARAMSERQPAVPASSPTIACFRRPSLVAHILRPITVR